MSSPASVCLLLVEDDPLVRDTVAMMLEEEGYDVVEAADALGALQMVRNGLDAPLIVTDVDLGPGPSGADLADELRRLRPELSIIFITGRMTSLQGRTLHDREAILPKPFESSALSRMVKRMAFRPGAPGA